MDKDKIKSILVTNAITATRGPLGIAALESYNNGHRELAAGLLLLGYTTDVIDGVLARKHGIESKLGWLNDRINDGIYFGSLSIILGQAFYSEFLPEEYILPFIAITTITFVSSLYAADHFIRHKI